MEAIPERTNKGRQASKLALPVQIRKSLETMLARKGKKSHVDWCQSKSTIKLLEDIPNEAERTKRIDVLKQSKAKFPFRDIYYLGVFQQCSLLKA
jgi:hypothetical protein